MAAVAFPAAPGVEEKMALFHFAVGTNRALGRLLKSDFDRVVNVIAAMEWLRSFARRIEQMAQSRDGAVVEIGCAQPKAVERWGKVAVGIKLGHGRAIDSHLFDLPIGLFRRCFRPGMSSFRGRSDFGERDHFARKFAARLVAGGTISVM